MSYYSYRLLLLLSLLVCGCVQAIKHEDDPCILQANFFNNTFWLGTVEQALQCILRPQLQYTVQQQTVSVLSKVYELYAFSDMVANSTGAYHLSVNIPEMLHKFSTYSYSTDYEFHMDIVKGFASLQDANTMYVAPAGYRMFWTVTPFILSADIASDGSQILRATPNILLPPKTYSAVLRRLNYSDIDISPFYGRRIIQINNTDALQFVLEQAKTSGMYKDTGVQLNRILSGAWIMGFLNAGISFLGPSSYSILFEGESNPLTFVNFAVATMPLNGTMHLLELNAHSLKSQFEDSFGAMANHGGFAVDLTALEMANHQVDQLKSNTFCVECEEIAHPNRLRAVAVQMDSIANSWMHLLSRSQLRKRDIYPITITNCGEKLKSGSTEQLKVYGGLTGYVAYMSYKDTSVLKLNSFAATENITNHWLNTIAALTQKRIGNNLNKNLIIDVTGNTGGELCLAYYLLSYLVHAWDRATFTSNSVVYEPFDFRRSEITNDLLHAGYLRGEKVVSPSTRRSYDELDVWYTAGPAYERGGLASQYTSRFLWNVCGKSTSSIVETLPRATDHFDKILILTDGRCSGTCAYFVSKLRKDNKVRVLSVGGILGEPLEAASAAGGSTEHWDEWITELRKHKVSIPGMGYLPTSAELSFTFREVYIGSDANDKLGGSSLGVTTLPREFNKLVADWHINSWCHLHPGISWTSQPYVDLYETALAYFDKIPPGLPGNNFWTPGVVAGIVTLASVMCVLLVVIFFISWKRAHESSTRLRKLRHHAQIGDDEDQDDEDDAANLYDKEIPTANANYTINM